MASVSNKLKKTFKVKEVLYSDSGKRLKETEKLVEGVDEVYITPDTTAQIFWLKNRKPNTWRDKTPIDTYEAERVQKTIDNLQNFEIKFVDGGKDEDDNDN